MIQRLKVELNFGNSIIEVGELALDSKSIFSHSVHGFHSTTYDGEGKNPTIKHLLNLADYFNIKNTNKIIEEVKESLSNWNSLAKNSGVSKVSISTIQKQLNNI